MGVALWGECGPDEEGPAEAERDQSVQQEKPALPPWGAGASLGKCG